MDQGSQMPLQEVTRKSVGPFIGIIIIVIVLVIGAFYFWGAKLNQEPVPQLETAPLSQSDEIADISADLDATVIGDIEESLGAMEAELSQ